MFDVAVSQIVEIQCVFFDREDSLDKVFCRTVKNAEEGKESLAVEQSGVDGGPYRIFYQYDFREGKKPLWRKKAGKLLVEREKLRRDGSFLIVRFNQMGKVVKAEEYSAQREWRGTVYYSGKNRFDKAVPVAEIHPAAQPGTLCVRFFQEMDGVGLPGTGAFEVRLDRNLDGDSVELLEYLKRNGEAFFLCAATSGGNRCFVRREDKERIDACAQEFRDNQANLSRPLFSGDELDREKDIAEKSPRFLPQYDWMEEPSGPEVQARNSQEIPCGIFYDEAKKILNIGELEGEQLNGFGIQYEIAGSRVEIGRWEKEKLSGEKGKSSHGDGIENRGFIPENMRIRIDGSEGSVLLGQWECGAFAGIEISQSGDGAYRVLKYPEKEAGDQKEVSILQKDGALRYSGGWKENRPEGIGVGREKDGWYLGQWKNGSPSGTGVFLEKESSCIAVAKWQGEIPKDSVAVFDREGQLLYSGQLQEGQRSGTGVGRNPDTGEIFVGRWSHGIMEGMGSAFSGDGALLYFGEWKENLRCGYGCSYNTRGEKEYEGMWRDGRYHGRGCLWLPEGGRLEGDFANGKLNGYGCRRGKDGEKSFEGQWRNGSPSGHGRSYLPQGGWIEGEFSAGELVGIGNCYDGEGALLYHGEFSDSRYHGQGTLYQKRKKRYEGGFAAGLFHGVGASYNSAGLLEYFGEFENGQKNGCGVLFEGGEARLIGVFYQGRPKGRVDEFRKGRCYASWLAYEQKPAWGLLYGEDGVPFYFGETEHGLPEGRGCILGGFCEELEQGIFQEGRLICPGCVQLEVLEGLPRPISLENTIYTAYLDKTNYRVGIQWGKGSYSGQVNQKGEPEGRGNLLYDGYRYQGEFYRGEPCGQGSLREDGGVSLSGLFHGKSGKEIEVCFNQEDSSVFQEEKEAEGQSPERDVVLKEKNPVLPFGGKKRSTEDILRSARMTVSKSRRIRRISHKKENVQKKDAGGKGNF